tara:strand:+ start:3820 stop:4560 length:741 start_codon:yes stop_codon:yes gene_type:complete
MSELTAGIIIIGDEILSGRTQDTNSNFIAKKLTKSGIQLKEIIVIPDKEDVIINSVRNFHKSFTYVFTTGGIGPTHDDITSESISKAFNKKYIINSEAFNILKNFYPDGEFNKSRQRMSKMPEEAILIPNPLTAAPGFILENVIVLPGVPSIMKNMIDYVFQNIKKGKPKKILTIKINLFESAIADKLSIIQKNNPKCSIGSYPYFNYVSKTGGVNIVVSSWELENLEDIVNQIKESIKILGGKII